jgi:hypothetical protein
MKPHSNWDDFIFWGDAKRLTELIGHTGEQDIDQPLQKIFSSKGHIFTSDFFRRLDTGRAITLKRFLREIKLARSGEQGLFKKEESEVWNTVLLKGVSCFWLAYLDKTVLDIYGI